MGFGHQEHLWRKLQGVHRTGAIPIEHAVKSTIKGAEPALKGLGFDPPDLSRLRFEHDIAAAVEKADVVQENGPERLDFKQELWAKVEAAAPKEANAA